MVKSKKKKNKQFPIKAKWIFAGIAFVSAIIFAVSVFFKKETAVEIPLTPGFNLTEVSFANLEGFNNDNLIKAASAMQKSCEIIVKKPIEYYADKAEWQNVCNQFLSSHILTTPSFKRFLKSNFIPYLVSFDGNPKGTFTGYYIPLLNGSLEKTEKFNTPVYAEPDDIVYVDVEKFFPECQGCKIIGKVENKRLGSYPGRHEIDTSGINAKPLIWLDSNVDNFILHIQGSGKVQLPTGETKTIGFNGSNGLKFVGIGSLMIKEKLIPSGDYSMPSIKTWLEQNPEKAQELMWKNPRYIFFRFLDTYPVGAQGVPLTPKRSLAVDNHFISYGVPIWLDAFDADNNKLQRLMLAQDTGNAIKGAVRGDFFWGEGDDAFMQAGRMKKSGQYYVLLPKNNYLNNITPKAN